MKKKADITTGTIIIFVLVLAVVVILAWFFTDRFTIFQKSLNCEESGGICTTECHGEPVLLGGCEKEEVCCLGVS